MNTNEILQVLKQAQAIGLTTCGQLAQFFAEIGAKTNRDKLNGLNAFACRGYIVRGEY